MKKILALTAFLVFVSGCSTWTPQRYSISADNNVAIKNIASDGIFIGDFKEPVEFNRACRAAGPIAAPDGMGFGEYIKKAIESELKVAGKYNQKDPTVTLTGIVERLEFSSSRGLTGGSWDIGLRVNSSNEKFLFVQEHYEFESGFDAFTACKQTAEAFNPAVQNLIGKLVTSPKFQELIMP